MQPESAPEPKHLYWGRLVNDIRFWKVNNKGTLSVDDIELALEELKQAKQLLKVAASFIPFDGEDGILTNKRKQIQEWLANHDEVTGYTSNALGSAGEPAERPAPDNKD